MLKGIRIKCLSLALVVCVLCMANIFVVPMTVYAAGTTYYVDSVSGDDSNDGISTGTPWKTLDKLSTITFQPGDNILLKAGSVWNGEGAVLHGSGTVENPITIGKYGSGSNPVLNGNGVVDQLIYIRNISYWTVQDLEITNTADEDFVYTLMGVRVEAINIGTVSGITLQNLNIHDINGIKGVGASGKPSFPACIYFNSGGTVTASKFDNVLVQNCTTWDSICNGLNFYSSNTSAGGPYSTNVRIHNVSGNCAQIHWMLDGAIVENCHISNAGGYKPQYNSTYFAAMFPTYCKDITYQYNEIDNTAFSGDSTGFDFDVQLKGTCIFQYNYTHDNAGTLLVMNQADANVKMIYRYNISQNDCAGKFSLGDSGVSVYNNVIYNPDGENLISTSGGASAANEFYNNIFIGNNMEIKADPGSQNPVFDYNVFYGYPGPADPHKINSDPMFDNIAQVVDYSTCDGFKLKSGSPCINSGKIISANGGEDFSGNALYYNGPDRGAFEYQGAVSNYVFEAESGTLANGAIAASDTKASNGQYVGGLATSNASCTISNINGDKGGEFYLKVMYSTIDSTVTKGLYVNGSKVSTLSYPVTTDASDFSGVAVTRVTLLSGAGNSIMIKNDGSTATDLRIDRLILIPVNKIYQAEDGIAGGGAVVNTGISNAWNEAVVGSLDTANAYSLISNIEGYDGGTFQLKLRYANGNSSAASKGLYVNGSKIIDVNFPATGSWTAFSEVTQSILLKPGNINSIMLMNDSSNTDRVDLDAFTVVKKMNIYEAENGTLSGGTLVMNNTNASGWNCVDGFGISNAYCQMDDVFAPGSGSYRVGFRYSSEASGATKGIFVNGSKVANVTFGSTGSMFDFSYAYSTVTLNQGMNSIVIKNDNANAGVIYLDRIEVMPLSVTPAPTPVPTPTPGASSTTPEDIQFMEAERCEISEGGTITGKDLNASGEGFTGNYHYAGRYIKWNNVNGGAGGAYTLNIRYRTGNDNAKLGLYVNGARQGAVDFPNTGWGTYSSVTVALTLGPGYDNTIMLKNDELPGSISVTMDSFQLLKQGVTPPPTVTPTPGPNLLTNPGFENGSTDWTLGSANFTISSADKYSETYSLKLTGTRSYSGALQRYDVEPYHVYEVSFYAKCSTANTSIRILDPAGKVLAEKTISGNNTWTLYSIRYNAGNNMRCTLYIGDNGSGTFYYDDFIVNKISATPQYPNILSNGQFDAKSVKNWTLGSNFSLSKENKYTGIASIRLSGTGSSRSMSQAVNVTAGTDYTMSFMCKAPNGNITFKVTETDGSDVTTLQTVSASEKWTLYTVNFNSGSNTQIMVNFYDAASGTGYIDDIQLKRY